MNGQGAARKLLSEAEVSEGLRLDEETLETLRKISTSPGRNAAAQLGAIKLRLEFSQSKPKQQVEHSGKVTLEQLVAGSMPEGGTR